jgi:hypothetical protein
MAEPPHTERQQPEKKKRRREGSRIEGKREEERYFYPSKLPSIYTQQFPIIKTTMAPF